MEAASPIAGGIPAQVPQLPQISMEVAAQAVNQICIMNEIYTRSSTMCREAV